MSNKDLLNVLAEDIEDRTGERAYEVERTANRCGCGENPDDILEILKQFGY